MSDREYLVESIGELAAECQNMTLLYLVQSLLASEGE